MRLRGHRRNLFKKQRGKCYYCGRKLSRRRLTQQNQFQPTVDHVVPLGQGGEDKLRNKIMACQACNRSKGNKTPEQWVEVS